MQTRGNDDLDVRRDVKLAHKSRLRLIDPWCCDRSISLDRRQIPLSRIIEGTAATSGLESGQRRQHQRNRFLVALMSRSAIVLYVSTPQIIRYWQATACPRAAGKPATYRSPRSSILAALVPSVGTITLQIELRSRAGAMNARASEHCRRTAASHRRAKLYKFERHNDRPLLHQ